MSLHEEKKFASAVIQKMAHELEGDKDIGMFCGVPLEEFSKEELIVILRDQHKRWLRGISLPSD